MLSTFFAAASFASQQQEENNVGGTSVTFGSEDWSSFATAPGTPPESIFFCAWTNSLTAVGSGNNVQNDYPFTIHCSETVSGQPQSLITISGNIGYDEVAMSWYLNQNITTNTGDFCGSYWQEPEEGYPDGEPTETQLRGWVWVGWHIQPTENGCRVTQYAKIGVDGPVFISATDTVNNGSPEFCTPVTMFLGGDGERTWQPEFAMQWAKAYAMADPPSLAMADAIALRTTPDTSAWGDWPLVGGSLNDVSGNGRHLTATGSLGIGPAGPMLTGAQAIVSFTTTGSSFAPEIVLADGSIAEWIFSDGSTSTSATPTASFGSSATRHHTLRVTPADGLQVINVGYGADDIRHGWTPYESLLSSVSGQGVSAIDGLRSCTGLLVLCISRNTGFGTLDLSGIPTLVRVEAYQATISEVILGATNLERLCFEGCGLSGNATLDLSGSLSVIDLRGASCSYQGITWGDTIRTNLDHVCIQLNANLRGDVIDRVHAPNLRELFIAQTDQIGEYDLSGFTRPLSEVLIFSNPSVTSLDLTGSTGIVLLDARGCGFDQGAVDAILLAFVTNGATGGSLDLTNTEVPSEAGLASVATLEGRGWTVLVDAA